VSDSGGRPNLCKCWPSATAFGHRLRPPPSAGNGIDRGLTASKVATIGSTANFVPDFRASPDFARIQTAIHTGFETNPAVGYSVLIPMVLASLAHLSFSDSEGWTCVLLSKSDSNASPRRKSYYSAKICVAHRIIYLFLINVRQHWGGEDDSHLSIL
jgi:hypothetical protein